MGLPPPAAVADLSAQFSLEWTLVFARGIAV